MILNLLSLIAAANGLGINLPDSSYILSNEDEISQNCILAADSMNFSNLLNNQNAVIDLNGNIFLVQESEDSGFLIYDPISEECLESVRTELCPYNFQDEFTDFYLGPLSYYYRNGNSFYHCSFIENTLSLYEANHLQLEFANQLDEFRSITSNEAFEQYIENNPNSSTISRLHTNGRKIYINNYEIVRDCAFPYNNDNSCGFVSGSILLNYWNKTVHDGTVLPCFYDNFAELNTNGTSSTCLSKKLITYNNGNPDSTARTVANAINCYCSDYNIHGSASWSLGKIGLEQTLLSDKPAAIFGWFPNVQKGGMCSHAVTCYGFDTRWWGGYYIVNYGWDGRYTEVSLGFGLVGETLFFSLDENYYQNSWTIKPTDYNFGSSYCTNVQNKTINLFNYSFDTRRYRCGYIENQYVNLSPRKQGYDTAFLEYNFKNPVNTISLNLSFWSNDERYNYPNRAIALIQYKDLMDNEWKTKMDLLNDVNLSENRNQQDTLNFSFPNKTREFRIYTHFDYISGQNDRNKGRICIGNMLINSYI